MTLPDQTPARKPRRWGLYLPFVLLALGVAGWSGMWLYLRGQATQAIDADAARLREAGYQVSWKERRIAGYPFRLNITFIEPRLGAPSGWGVAAPMIDTEAFVHAPGNWLLAAPQGLTFTRPRGGPVAVSGEVIRASLTHLANTPPNFSFEGVKLAFAPPPGAQPFALAGAERVELHLRAVDGDSASSVVRVATATPRPGSLLALIARGQPVDIGWDAALSKVSAFHGADWASAVRAWSLSGGTATVRQVGITAGPAELIAKAGTLSVDSDGRLRGQLDASLRQAPRALAVLGQAGAVAPQAAAVATAVATAREENSVVNAKITFQAGQTTLGPVALAAAPKIY